MKKQPKPRGHSRHIPRMGWSVECLHTTLDGRFQKVMAQLLRDCLPHCGQWVRIEFAGC